MYVDMSDDVVENLSPSDWEFVNTLTRKGHVRVYSNQVSFQVTHRSSLALEAKDALRFPSNWGLEWIGIDPSKYDEKHIISMTWRILKPEHGLGPE